MSRSGLVQGIGGSCDPWHGVAVPPPFWQSRVYWVVARGCWPSRRIAQRARRRMCRRCPCPCRSTSAGARACRLAPPARLILPCRCRRRRPNAANHQRRATSCRASRATCCVEHLRLRKDNACVAHAPLSKPREAPSLFKCRRVMNGKRIMFRIIFALMLPLTLGGCFSYSDSTPAPTHTTVVVPSGSVVTCANGAVPPC